MFRDRQDYAEPYRIKMVEKINLVDKPTREQLIKEAGYNVFSLPAEAVYIDLLTDSGTAAMSDYQWAGMMMGDESYAGSKNYYHLKDSVKDVMGYDYVAPTHQGRGAEHILMNIFVRPGDRVLGNMHFDTTEGHILLRGAEPVNCLAQVGYDVDAEVPFKGNFDLDLLEEEIRKDPSKAALILITITCNNNGGQPVSMENIKGVKGIADKYNIPVFFDAARFAENAYFIKQLEPGFEDKAIGDIVKEMFSYGDGCTMSAKKDALVNIGGFLAFRKKEDYEKALEWQIPFEGFATYGGLAGRDLEAIARGLREVLDEYYLEDRIGQVRYLGSLLSACGVPIVKPTGGHGVYVDAKSLLPHLPRNQFPAQALTVELYLEGGVRGVELGGCAFGHKDPETGEDVWPELELVRLTIPRRVYTDRHMDYVARTLRAVKERASSVRGLKIVHEAPVLRHFTAKFERV
ncbi:MAG TPA: tryptophanase [Bacillota bacterium]|nr:tryptophanase [Candidatus Fermentithermobacillaceae bacterium]HOK63998.1 tryptophanase [Bacillota bacterium]HOL11353.1 tryptophanase [Bacillota bacterium]HOQ02482.1 tryptophanase [Bacillota bacterium]HPP60161.1 tryptophanase [Bacillota bacterium]